MGKARRKNRRSVLEAPVGDQAPEDVLVLHDDDAIESEEESQWLTNRVIKQSEKRPKRGEAKIRYDVKDVCIIGLERILSIVRDDTFDTATLTTVEGQVRLTEMYHKRFLEAMLDRAYDLTADEILQHRKSMDKIDALVETVNKALTQRKEQLVREEQSTSIQNATFSQTHEASHNDIRVKKLEIEKFAGDDRKWPQFKSMFEDCFHKRTDMSGNTKIYHLMAHLESGSEAHMTISELPRTEDGYQTAWKTLCDAYDNERKIVNDIVLTFVDMPSVDQPSRSELIRLINKTNHLVQSLPRFGVQVQHWDPIIVPLLVRKMDGESIRMWSLERHPKEIAKLAPLLEFIRKRADGMDADFVVRYGQNQGGKY